MNNLKKHDATDFVSTCKVCGKGILTPDGNAGYCEEHSQIGNSDVGGSSGRLIKKEVRQ